MQAFSHSANKPDRSGKTSGIYSQSDTTPANTKTQPPDTMKGAGSSTYTLKHYFYTDGVGFEPTEGCPSAVFKTAAFNRSATHPSGAKREAILAYTARECKLFLSVGLNNIRNWQDQNARRRQRGA